MKNLRKKKNKSLLTQLVKLFYLAMRCPVLPLCSFFSVIQTACVQFFRINEIKSTCPPCKWNYGLYIWAVIFLLSIAVVIKISQNNFSYLMHVVTGYTGLHKPFLCSCFKLGSLATGPCCQHQTAPRLVHDHLWPARTQARGLGFI